MNDFDHSSVTVVIYNCEFPENVVITLNFHDFLNLNFKHFFFFKLHTISNVGTLKLLNISREYVSNKLFQIRNIICFYIDLIVFSQGFFFFKKKKNTFFLIHF